MLSLGLFWPSRWSSVVVYMLAGMLALRGIAAVYAGGPTRIGVFWMHLFAVVALSFLAVDEGRGGA